jgi:hypothetical protein
MRICCVMMSWAEGWGARDAFLVARVVGLLLLLMRCGGARRRATTVAHSLAYALKVGNGYQSTRAVQRIAGLVPLAVVFAADDVQKVAL